MAHPRQSPKRASPKRAVRDRRHPRDQVDRIIAGWAREWPDLDTSPAAIVGRVGRLTRFFDAGLTRTFKRFGLTRADFDVLAALRRSGPPYRLPQKALLNEFMRPSGATSVRVGRAPDARDKRGAFGTLTDKGGRRFDAVAPVHLANENRMLEALSARER